MSATTPNLPFGTQLIGRTEKSLSGILTRLLADRGLTEPEYVAMRVCSERAGSPRSEIEAQLASVFRKGDDHAADLLDRLTAAGIIAADGSGSLELTVSGRELRDGIAGQTNAITERLWGDIPAEHQEIAARVLSTVLQRAADERA